MVRVARLLLAGAALAVVVGAPADAATARIVTVAYEYVPPEVSIAKGDTLEYTNVDIAPHNVVSKVTKPDGNPLFSSKTVSAGTTVPVVGVDKLRPGAYTFVCTLHPGMVGTLFVKA